MQAIGRRPLEGKFDLLMVEAFLINEDLREADQFRVDGGELCLEGDIGLPLLYHTLLFGDRVGLDKAGYDVVPLHAENEVAVEADPRGWAFGVAGEDDARAGLVVQVAEHHGLDDDRRAPLVGQVHLTPVYAGLLRIP